MYCIAIAKDLVVATCPLLPGRCYWQHRETHKCAFTTDELSPSDFAARVGADLPSDEDQETFRASIKAVLQDSK